MTTPASPTYNLALPVGALVLNQYRIESVLGKPGGFGITYLSTDTALDKRVALKEYLPRGVATRKHDRESIQINTPEDGEIFRFGLTRFVKEARMLAKLDHPNIVRVTSYFEANGTAYFVMDYTPGRTVSRHMERMGGRLTEEMAVEIMVRVLDGLESAHQQNILHRDVKPENIYLTADGRPVLLDFGAARQALGGKSERLTALLTPSYAPLEQYAEVNLQGPWTDVYGCAASLYRMITGVDPVDALARLDGQPLMPPSIMDGACSVALSDVIVLGLAPDPSGRPRSAAEFQDMLEAAMARTGGDSDGTPEVDATVNPKAAKVGDVVSRAGAAQSKLRSASSNLQQMQSRTQRFRSWLARLLGFGRPT